MPPAVGASSRGGSGGRAAGGDDGDTQHLRPLGVVAPPTVRLLSVTAAAALVPLPDEPPPPALVHVGSAEAAAGACGVAAAAASSAERSDMPPPKRFRVDGAAPAPALAPDAHNGVRVIQLTGSNACGKTTRTYRLVKYLQQLIAPREPEQFMLRVFREKYQKKNFGLIFRNVNEQHDDWLVLGHFTVKKKGCESWYSFDGLGNWGRTNRRSRQWVIRSAVETSRCSNVFYEGSWGFGLQSGWSPTSVRSLSTKIARIHSIVMYYDNEAELKARLVGRTGSTFNKEKKTDSAWEQNRAFRRCYEVWKQQEERDGSVVVDRLDVEAPREELVRMFLRSGEASPYTCSRYECGGAGQPPGGAAASPPREP